MSSTSNYDKTNSTPILPGRDVVYNNVRSNTAVIDNLSVNAINGLPPPTAPPITAPPGSILTVTPINTALFNPNINLPGDLAFANQSGLPGQFVKKIDLLTQTWSDMTVNDIVRGLDGQVIVTSGSNTQWSLLNADNFSGQLPDTNLTVSSLGAVSFDKSKVVTLESPALPYSHITSNGANPSIPMWSRVFVGSEILFNNSISTQSPFNTYYADGPIELDVVVCNQTIGNVLPTFYANTMKASAWYTVVGRLVTLTITSFVIEYNKFTVIPPVTGFYYYSIKLDTPLGYTNPLTVVAPSNGRQAGSTHFYANRLSEPTYGSGTGVTTLYSNYYNQQYPVLEFNPTQAVPTEYFTQGFHGIGFQIALNPSDHIVWTLNAPLTITYIRD